MNCGEQGYAELQVSTITTTTNFVIEDTHALYVVLSGRMAKIQNLNRHDNAISKQYLAQREF